MPWAAAAAVAGAAISAGASNNAAKKQAGAADRASGAVEDQYWQTREDQAPWRGVGESALRQLAVGIGGSYMPSQSAENFDPAAYLKANPGVAADPYYSQHPYEHFVNSGANEGTKFTYKPEALAQGVGANGTGTGVGEFNRDFTLADFQKDPGYDFRLNQGLDAVQGSRAAKGSMLSGSTLKALNDYGSNYASSEYGKAYDRFNNDQTTRFNRLATIAGIGQTATNNVGAAGAAAANGVAGNIIGAGNAAASGAVGTANAINGGMSNLQSLYQLNQLNKKPGTSGYYTGGAQGSSAYGGSGSANFGDGNAGYGDYSAYYGG